MGKMHYAIAVVALAVFVNLVIAMIRDSRERSAEERDKAQYMRECLRHNLAEQCEALWKYREEQR